MSDASRCYALVPCAGVGQRAGAGGPKQYAPLAGRPVVAHTLQALGAVKRIKRTLVVLAPDDKLFEQHVEGFTGWLTRSGGATRADTVAAGLRALRMRGAADSDWVLVHDAARCMVRPELIDKLIDACLPDEVGGLLALPLADTLKQDDGKHRVAQTLDRSGKWLAQTPQMFRLGTLQVALAAAGEEVTDEASAIEFLGHSPLLVQGEVENFKLTYPADFALARRLLESR
jgi:2-C-methyl-D-erythritol 4-phosphate cytidylyltransferase